MEGADKDCNLLFDGRPVRHVRLDARVAVIDEIKRKYLYSAESMGHRTLLLWSKILYERSFLAESAVSLHVFKLGIYL